ncbi:MAG: hypothetical protein A2Y15_03800 [Clostridiales bacterium GWF2_36_10]|nr:MAG: hypothetical protein A2Y15_03800 [Clostridiales bacterium GWF2_36_10]HAN22093.1 hypothetical protein [Clostridiales bacterium]
MNTNRIPNRLANEKSPYLQQHMYNPVSWFPWSKDAFLKAKTEDKPIFLSIGYSTCHWCHVMERESFENEETAEILNKHFISIKVDREERPDVDAVYMEICMAMNKSGGWPLTVLMTPDQKPFYTATYLPKKGRYGMFGLDDLLFKIAQTWENDKDKLTSSAESISSFIKERINNQNEKEEPTIDLLENAKAQLQKAFDVKFGGFGSAPKFPTPHNLLFLLYEYNRSEDKQILLIVEKTLDQMYKGGIFDHIGGGFSRYSTDSKWLVPHFEKMLYDNALLLYLYSEAYRATKKELYRYVSSRIVEYIKRELTHDNGGFFCGQDADSEGVEGKYYVFSPEEIKNILGEEEGKEFCHDYDISPKGNFEGKNISNLINNSKYIDVHEKRKKDFSKLYEYRLSRIKLHKDDKILVSWNSLMISALAKAYFVFGDESYLQTSEKAFLFLKNNLIDNNGRLMVRWRDNDSAGDGKLDDYAFFIWAALEIYDVTLNIDYLQSAIKTNEIMLEHFFDFENGGFYSYADDSEQLLTRPKEIYDGAMPSGNSVAAYVLTKLSSLTADVKLKEIADKQFEYIAGEIKNYPAGYTFSLIAVQRYLYSSTDLVCVSKDQKISSEIIRYLREKFMIKNELWHINTILKTKENSDILTELIPFTREYYIPLEDNNTMYYLCKNNTCKPPVTQLEELEIFN